MRLLTGPAGGGCAMTSRALSDRVGGFRERPKEVFWIEDGAYIEEIERIGYRAAVLADLRVHHTGGSYYTQASREKEEHWKRYWAEARTARGREANARPHPLRPQSQRALRLVRRALLSGSRSAGKLHSWVRWAATISRVRGDPRGPRLGLRGACSRCR